MAVIESTTFRPTAGVDARALLAADAAAVAGFWSGRPGFDPASRTLTVAADGTWTTRVRWDSLAEAEAAHADAAGAAPVADLEALTDAGTRTRTLDVEVPPVDGVRATNARGLYLEGIRDGHPEQALARYTGARYTQHSTGVRDGREGFLEFFAPFLAAHPQREITLHRSITDGRYVFVHVSQRLDGGAANWVTMDLFDTDADGRIVEHWDVIAALQPEPNPAGRTQVDGATEITDLHLTEANKDVVRRLLTEGLAKDPTSDLAQFISGDTYLQHNPEAPDGLDGLQRMVEGGRATGETLYYERVHRLVGQGNFVAALSHQVWNGIGYAAFDLFRLEGGLVVEHWDAVEPLPDPADLVNSGKF
jgi:predicted SnoaL-like aldol condensation-catalyzing enzyme